MVNHNGYKNLKYSWSDLTNDIDEISKIIKREGWVIDAVYGPPRGGCVPAVMLSHKLKLKYLTTLEENHNPEHTIIIDDVSDEGKTLSNIPNIKKYKTITLFIKTGTSFLPDTYCRSIERNVWICYPWEVK